MPATPSLFGDEAEAKTPEKPRTPAPKWLVDELVDRFGVERPTAEGYELKQAYAVRAKCQRQADKAGGKIHPGELKQAPGASPTERLAAAAELEAVVGEFERGEATADELFRVLRGVLYVLAPGELKRVALGLLPVMRANGDLVARPEPALPGYVPPCDLPPGFEGG